MAHKSMTMGMPAARTKAVKFYLIRHGSTRLNNHNDETADRIRGWLDVPLSPEGKKEAKQTAQDLKNTTIDMIRSSDLVRAMATAEALGKVLDVKVSATRVLRPWDMGDFSGEKVEDVKADLKKYAIATPDKPAPNGESFNTFKSRCLGGIVNLLKTHPDNVLALVTHHRVERLLKAWISAGQKPSYTLDEKIFLDKGEAPGSFEIMSLRVPK